RAAPSVKDEDSRKGGQDGAQCGACREQNGKPERFDDLRGEIGIAEQPPLRRVQHGEIWDEKEKAKRCGAKRSSPPLVRGGSRNIREGIELFPSPGPEDDEPWREREEKLPKRARARARE